MGMLAPDGQSVRTLRLQDAEPSQLSHSSVEDS